MGGTGKLLKTGSVKDLLDYGGDDTKRHKKVYDTSLRITYKDYQDLVTRIGKVENREELAELRDIYDNFNHSANSHDFRTELADIRERLKLAEEELKKKGR